VEEEVLGRVEDLPEEGDGGKPGNSAMSKALDDLKAKAVLLK